MRGGFHQFRAPIDGKSFRFAMRCDEGTPKMICCQEWSAGNLRLSLVLPQIEVINKLLTTGMPWAAIAIQQQGDIGAVIEAAEARRAELYGALAEVTA